MQSIRTLATALLLPVLAVACGELPSESSARIEAPGGDVVREITYAMAVFCPSSTLAAGTSMQCYAQTYNGFYVNATYASGNKPVATVTNRGYVTGVAPGTATIYANWYDGANFHSGSTIVTVY